MSYQYIYTSAKRGLEPGKSGFCCVARDREIPPDLMNELDQRSSYLQSSIGMTPTIMRYRIVKLRSGTYHILSRIQDSGIDYSKRNNHIAHHLAFTSNEVGTLPNPASILLDWSMWNLSWEEPPRVLNREDAFSINDLNTKWNSSVTYGDFPPAVNYGEVFQRVFDISNKEEISLIEHYRNSLKELRFKEQWNCTFTNILLPTDDLDDYTWSGVWEDMQLPYELDFHAKPVERAARPAAPESEEIKPIPEEPVVEETETSFIKKAPKVEIPLEFDRRKRKRPRRPVSKKELSRWINYALGIAMALCIVIALFFYRNNHEGLETIIDEKRGIPVPKRLSPLELARSTWNEFKAAGFPASELDSITPHISTLVKVGDTQPSLVINFLRLLNSDEPITWPNLVPVPGELIEVSTDYDVVRLSVSVTDYPRLTTLSFLPKVLVPEMQKLELTTANSMEPLDRQEPGTFDRATFEAALESFESNSIRSIFSVSPETKAAMDRFDVLRQDALENEKFAPLLSIHSVFGLPDSASYISFGRNGFLNNTNLDSYPEFAIALYSDYVLANYGSIRNTSAFRSSFGLVTGSNYDNPYDAMQAIYDSMLIAEPKTNPQKIMWMEMRAAWVNAFVRSDLMAQTIVAYTIEAIQDTKKELVDLQSNFSQEDIAARDQLLKFSELVENVSNHVESLSSNEEWVVFDK